MLKRLFENEGLPVQFCSAEAKEGIIASVREYISSSDLRVSGDNDNAVWEYGWGDILNSVKKTNSLDFRHLAPHYYGRSDYLRFSGHYIQVPDADFELAADLTVRKHVLNQYLGDVDRVVELGCGTGLTTLLLSRMFPNIDIQASDWSTASVELIDKIARQTNGNISGHLFNMLTLERDESLLVDENSVVISMHALEQLGDKFDNILQFLLDSGPRRCIHLEPIVELYNPEVDFDNVALSYHQKRNYLNGFLPRLEELQKQGRINIVDINRTGFGGFYHEAYTAVVWEPK